MNSGVIIVFSNNEKEIINFDTEYLTNINASKICFVNNASSDNTLNLLNDIQFKSKKNIYILDIKLDKGLKAAIKSGARLLLSESDFDFIVYLKPDMLDSLFTLSSFLLNFQENKQDYKSLPTRSTRNVLYDVFSIQEIMKKKQIA